MFLELFLLPAFLALASASAVVPAAPVALAAAPAPVLARFSDETVDPNPSYSFAYDVQDALTGDSKGHIESRANGIVQGQYNVAEPDGTRRIVDYTADPINGFNALVRKEPLTFAAAPVLPASPVIAARTAKVVSAPVVAKAAPLVAKAAPVVARTAPLVAQPAPLVAQPAPVVAARSAPVVAAPALSAPLFARSAFVAAPSASLLAARSYGFAPAAAYFNAPLTYAVV